MYCALRNTTLYAVHNPQHTTLILKNLDRVDWDSLQHAYGPATDIPDMLRAILSPDAEEQEVGFDTLAGVILHQSTVYSASAAAVPFLYELLTHPDTQQKTDIACLLARLANGYGYLEVHAVTEPDAATWREILADYGKTLEEELAREAAETRAVHEAVAAGLPHLAPYLTDPEVRTRWAVAIALGNYPDQRDWSLPAIEAALATELDEEIREILLKSKARLSQQV